MRVKVFPSSVSSSINIPPSKSISHRAIICACLSQGRSRIVNIAYSKDIMATIGGMRALGAKITEYENYVVIEGIGEIKANTPLWIDCNESGSTLRFFIPIFSLCNQKVTFWGQGRLLSRPQSIYQELFEKQELLFLQSDDSITIEGTLKASEYELCGDISSQFITGLLLALPMLQGNSIIKIKPPFESRSYVELTLQTMAEFGVVAQFIDEHTISVTGNQQYQATNYKVEGDFSQMAFYAVMAAINGNLTILDMCQSSKQGDKEIVEILRRFGAQIHSLEDSYSIQESKLFASDIDLSNCPDLGPILTVLCAFSEGESTIFNAVRLRIKESDRIDAMETQLKKLGVNISSTFDSITINGRNKMTGEVTVFAHNDHRIAMSLAVFAACSEYPVTIEGAECVEKSYPNFYEDLKKIGVRLEIIE
ncbi:MAG: 3-phosphoshikimate 1-carboxyvinyltransferase [Oscillospiraceae bacterium]